MITSVVSRWGQFWFAPKEALTLAFCRAAFFGLMFSEYVTEPFAPWANVPRDFWDPVWLFETFHIPVLPEQALFAGEILWKVSLAAACVGLLTRFSTATAFVLGLYLLGLRHNWGKASHDDAAPIFIMGLLALSRCGDAFSLDALIRRRRPSDVNTPGPPATLPSGEYRWPIRAVWLVLAMVFFNSAIAKLRKSGLEWAFSENLSVLMVRLNYFNKPTTDWGLRLANTPGFGQLMGAGALIVELFFPLVLFSRIARWILVPAAFLMQLGNKLLLGVDFTVFMFAYVFFIDWACVFARMGIVSKLPTAMDDTLSQRRAQVNRIPPPPLASPL